jgi:hypothetical protein
VMGDASQQHGQECCWLSQGASCTGSAEKGSRSNAAAVPHMSCQILLQAAGCCAARAQNASSAHHVVMVCCSQHDLVLSRQIPLVEQLLVAAVVLLIRPEWCVCTLGSWRGSSTAGGSSSTQHAGSAHVLR